MGEVKKEDILDILAKYDKSDITIATLGSHTSLHILQGAKEEGFKTAIEFKVFQAPVEVKEGGVVFCDCENIQPEDGSRVITRIIEGTEHFVECDTLITAISEKPDPELLEQARGLGNVWLAGDFLSGPATVVEAVASARAALDDMMQKL